jgi:2-iminobutanoate/2-iminopropanoate deaminase
MERVTIKPYDGYEISTFTIHNGVVYISHFGGSCDDNGCKLLTIRKQAEQTFQNLASALKKINLGLDNLAKVTVILRNISDFNEMHEVWKEYFISGNYPVRTTITSDFVDAHCLIQVDAIAVFDNEK